MQYDYVAGEEYPNIRLVCKQFAALALSSSLLCRARIHHHLLKGIPRKRREEGGQRGRGRRGGRGRGEGRR